MIASQVVRNGLMALPAVARWRSAQGRTSAASHDPDMGELTRCGYAVLDLVGDSVGASFLEGADIVEIGPGDHVPAGLLFLAAGARHYTCLDRFAGAVAGSKAKRLYAALVRSLEKSRPSLYDALLARKLDPVRFPEGYPQLVEIVKSPIEQWHGRPCADIVVSHNVVEHVTDMAAFARHTHAMLRPGGMAVHRVDFGAHDVWHELDDPLEWLRVPDLAWHLMGSRRGYPNRLRFDEVLAEFEAAGFDVDAVVLDRFSEAETERSRPQLAARFRNMTTESLAVRTARFTCWKNGSRSRRNGPKDASSATPDPGPSGDRA